MNQTCLLLCKSPLKDTGERKFAAAHAALRLSNDSEDIIRTLSRSKDPELVELALSKMEERGSESLKSTAIELLNNDNDAARRVAAQVLVKLLSREELAELLSSYVSQPTYYYNVVVSVEPGSILSHRVRILAAGGP